MLRKHASTPVIAVDDHNGKSSVLRKESARADFDYTPEPGYIYVRSRMISSRCNDNFDEFPAEEIKKAYKTFIGKPVFVNHQNSDHRQARGVIIDAALHEHVNVDGSPDVWVEGLMAIDAVTYPKLANAILRGETDRTSMGTDVQFSVCSACGNKATSPAEYCVHIPAMKGKKHFRYTASGEKIGEIIREKCYGLSFFENSILVEEPADPTAYFLGVDDRGLKTASKNKDGLRDMVEGMERAKQHGSRFDGVSLMEDGKGWFVATHRSRSDSYPTPEDIPESEIKKIEATGMRKGAPFADYDDFEECTEENSEKDDPDAYCGEIKHRTEDKKTAASDPPFKKKDDEDDEEETSDKKNPFEKKKDNSGDDETNDSDTPEKPQDRPGRPSASPSRADSDPYPQDTPEPSKSRKDQQKAPPEVDTLRDEDCPVCGNKDFFTGDRCQVCGFTLPPAEFRNPDTSLHKKLDLRDDLKDPDNLNQDGQLADVNSDGEIDENELIDPDQLESGDPLMLTCPNCEFQIESSPPVTETDEGKAPGITSGDLCPNCEEAELASQEELEDMVDQAMEEEDIDPEDADDTDPDADDESEEDEKDSEDAVTDNTSDTKKQKKSSSRKVNSMSNDMFDDLLRRVAVLETQNEYLAALAGVSNEYEAIRVHAEKMLKEADVNNPASPVADPASEAPYQTTEEALAPDTYDDPRNLGMSPGSTEDVPADQTDTPLRPGATMPTSPTNELQDVTAPVAGTENHVPNDQTRIETEVRVGNPDNPQPAFPWTLSSKEEDPALRAIASMRLADLQIQAGIAEGEGDKYDVAGQIQTSASTNEQIQREISTIESMLKAATKKRTFDSVPRISTEARQAPSLNEGSGLTPSLASHTDDAMDLFI